MFRPKQNIHKNLVEASFGVQNNDENEDGDPFEIEELEQFGSRFNKNGKQSNTDKQYEELMREIHKGKNNKKDSLLENDERYSGKKVGKTQLYQDNDEEIDSDLADIDIEEEMPKKSKKIEKISKKIKKNGKKPKKNFEKTDKKLQKNEKENLDEYLEEIENEDMQAEQTNLEFKTENINKAKSVRNQLKTYKLLLSFRLQHISLLEDMKKYPKTAIKSPVNLSNQLMIAYLLENLSRIQHLLLQKTNSKHNFKSFIPVYESIAPIFNKSNENSSDLSLNLDNIYKEFDEYYNRFFPWAEETLTKWSEKTNILTANLSKTGLKNLLHTPIGQVQRMMESFEKLQVKSQLKRANFRILGESLENLEKDFDEDIYDDSDLMQELMKGMMENSGPEDVAEDLPLFETTQQYLLERKLKHDEKKHKIVDRKASKNRKIKFEIHPKLINFMQSDERGGAIEGRNEILRTITKRFRGEDNGETIQEYNKNQENFNEFENKNDKMEEEIKLL